MNNLEIVDEQAGFYRIIALKQFRRTPGVSFDILPRKLIPRIDGIDRVIHQGGALSPGAVDDVGFPWYMHPHQDDNLMVLHGARFVDIYQKKIGRMLSFEVYPEEIRREGKTIHQGAAMLVWPRAVFHRIRSGDTGSASLNFATRYEGFDIRTNFNVYDLNTQSGGFRLIRAGHLDQFDVE